MATRTTKNKLYTPAGSDSLNLAADLATLTGDLDKRIPHSGIPFAGKNYIYSGGTLTNPSGHNVAVAAGVAMINGQTIDFTASGSLLMSASTSNYIFLVGTLDGNGFVTGYTWQVNTTGAVPSNGVLVAQVVEGASAPTSMLPTYRGIIMPGAQLAVATRTTDVSSAIAASGVVDAGLYLDIVGDGVTTYNFDSWGSAFYGTTLTDADLRIMSNAGPTYAGAARWRNLAAGSAHQMLWPKGQVQPFVGLRQFKLDAFAFQAGNVVFYANGYQMGLRCVAA